jgi:riboflavin synthase
VRIEVAAPADVLRYVVEKGSITVDGVSLTVAGVGTDWFGVAVIPHTLAVTTLGVRGPGDLVNLEVDVLAKYVERLLARDEHAPDEHAPDERAQGKRKG